MNLVKSSTVNEKDFAEIRYVLQTPFYPYLLLSCFLLEILLMEEPTILHC